MWGMKLNRKKPTFSLCKDVSLLIYHMHASETISLAKCSKISLILFNPFPQYDNSAADDFECILSKHTKSP